MVVRIPEREGVCEGGREGERCVCVREGGERGGVCVREGGREREKERGREGEREGRSVCVCVCV